MSLHPVIVQMSKMLTNLSRWLDKAAAHAKDNGYEIDILIESRLAPTQWPLRRQIQGACDAAKFAATRLAGRTPPAHDDTEKTLDELKTRITAVLELLATIGPDDLDGGETREVPLPFLPGKAAYGAGYLNEFALPNFYFHTCMAYAILRHNGVVLGKVDYIGGMELHDLPATE